MDMDRVEITAGGRTQMQEVLGAHGTTESDVTLTFGLGTACEIDQLVVHWPDAAGTVTTYQKLRANYFVELRKGELKPQYLNLDGTLIANIDRQTLFDGDCSPVQVAFVPRKSRLLRRITRVVSGASAGIRVARGLLCSCGMRVSRIFQAVTLLIAGRVGASPVPVAKPASAEKSITILSVMGDSMVTKELVARLKEGGVTAHVVDGGSRIGSARDALKHIEGKVAILGWSHGSRVAMRLATEFPDQVVQMSLMAPQVKTVHSAWKRVTGETQLPDFDTFVKRGGKDRIAGALINDLDMPGSYDEWKQERGIKIPTLMFHGTDDKIISHHYVRRVAEERVDPTRADAPRSNPGVKAYLYEGQRHQIQDPSISKKIAAAILHPEEMLADAARKPVEEVAAGSLHASTSAFVTPAIAHAATGSVPKESASKEPLALHALLESPERNRRGDVRAWQTVSTLERLKLPKEMENDVLSALVTKTNGNLTYRNDPSAERFVGAMDYVGRIRPQDMNHSATAAAAENYIRGLLPTIKNETQRELLSKRYSEVVSSWKTGLDAWKQENLKKVGEPVTLDDLQSVSKSPYTTQDPRVGVITTNLSRWKLPADLQSDVIGTLLSRTDNGVVFTDKKLSARAYAFTNVLGYLDRIEGSIGSGVSFENAVSIAEKNLPEAVAMQTTDGDRQLVKDRFAERIGGWKREMAKFKTVEEPKTETPAPEAKPEAQPAKQPGFFKRLFGLK